MLHSSLRRRWRRSRLLPRWSQWGMQCWPPAGSREYWLLLSLPKRPLWWEPGRTTRQRDQENRIRTTLDNPGFGTCVCRGFVCSVCFLEIRHTRQPHVPMFLMAWKMGGLKEKVPISKLFNASDPSSPIHPLISNPKIKELAFPFQYFQRGTPVLNKSSSYPFVWVTVYPHNKVDTEKKEEQRKGIYDGGL